MHYVKKIGLIASISLLIGSCSKDKYEATVPAYVTINSIDFTTNYSSQGSASNNITDAWVYVNDDLVGVFELPSTFPILRTGNVKLAVYGGIKDNGISTSRARYIPYDPHVVQVDLVAGETIEIQPTITYNSDVQFTWMEDFENASLSFLYTAGSDTTVFKQTNEVKEGAFSGEVYLKNDMDFFEATSIGYSNLPKDGTPVYLEMDFKTTETTVIGLYLDGTQYAVVNLNPTTEWKKIYVNMTDLVNSPVGRGASEIKVFFGIQDTQTNPFDADNPQIHLDNLKLIHF